MRHLYVRFGDIPKDEESTIHCGDVVVGKERGVSVYEGIEKFENGPVQILFPNLTYSACVSLSGVLDRPMYEVEGLVIDIGSDGEPVMTHVRIIRQIRGALQ